MHFYNFETIGGQIFLPFLKSSFFILCTWYNLINSDLAPSLVHCISPSSTWDLLWGEQKHEDLIFIIFIFLFLRFFLKESVFDLLLLHKLWIIEIFTKSSISHKALRTLAFKWGKRIFAFGCYEFLKCTLELEQMEGDIKNSLQQQSWNNSKDFTWE